MTTVADLKKLMGDERFEEMLVAATRELFKRREARARASGQTIRFPSGEDRIDAGAAVIAAFPAIERAILEGSTPGGNCQDKLEAIRRTAESWVFQGMGTDAGVASLQDEIMDSMAWAVLRILSDGEV